MPSDEPSDLDLPTDDPVSDELESSDDWGLLAGDDEGGTDAGGEALDFGASSAHSAAPIAVDPELLEDGPHWQTRPSPMGKVAGGLVVFALFSIGLLGGLFPTTIAAPRTQVLGAGLELHDLSGRFIDHAAAGPIYVVSGRLRNAGSAPAETPWLSVELVSESGRAVSAQAPIGLPHATRDLREAPLTSLSRRRPLASVHRTFRPGEERAFEAVVGSVPNGAIGFRVVDGALPMHLPAAALEAGNAPDAPTEGALEGILPPSAPAPPPAAPAD